MPSPALFEKPHKFETLDAMRGIAALAIVTGHTSPMFGGHFLFFHGYLAVDFFFMLSGFVLSFAYQRKLDAGEPVWAFFRTRIIRLYPLYALGLLLSVLANVYVIMHKSEPVSLHQAAIYAALAVFFLPAPASMTSWAPPAMMFPFNVPTWSLFFELIANVLHAALLRRRSTRTLLIALALIWILLAICILRQGHVDFGPYRGDVLLGLLRVSFGYLTGILLFRWWSALGRRPQIWALAPVLVLLAVFAVPRLNNSGLYDLLVVTLVLPVVLMLASLAPTPRGFGRVSQALGLTSYAIYVLHVPLYQYGVKVFEVLHQPIGSAWWPGVVFVVVLVAICLAVDKLYDVPVRKALRRRFERRTT